jgi:sortase (surface protein transpeptidase)
LSSAVRQPDANGFARPPKPPNQRRARIAGVVIGLGVLLAVGGVGYLISAEIARSQLGALVYDVPQSERAAWLTAPAPSSIDPDIAVPGSSVSGISDPEPGSDGIPGDSASAGPFDPTQLYPARWTNPRYWSEPEWAGSLPYGGADLPEGFAYANPADIISSPGTFSEATTLEIPAIGLSTSVYRLSVYDEGGRQLWESPVDIVGHIPGSARPGEPGAGWYFGHLESPVRGEGNVFHDLPDVVDLIQHDPVDIIIGSDDGEFLYRVTGTGFIHRDDLVLEESSASTVTLVSSYPRLVYDHRLLVTGELLAYRAPG